MFKDRKTVILFLTVVSILSFLYFGRTEGKNLNNLFISKDEYDSIVETHSYDYSLTVDEISFDGYEALRDNSQNIYYSMIEGNSSAYNPKVNYSKGDYSLALFGEEISDWSIENNSQIKILVYNNDSYNEYTLIVTKLPVMTVTTREELAIGETVKGNMTLFDNRKDAAVRFSESQLELNIRGHMSLTFPKSSYRMTLYEHSLGDNKRENNISLLGLRKDADYILYADFNETEKVRNVFSSNLWKYSCAEDNSYGLDNGVEYKYVELICNNEYAGLYALGYKIDGDVTGLGNDEIMYKLQHLHSAERDLDLDAEGPVKNYEVVKAGENITEEWQVLKDYYKTLFSEYGDDCTALYNAVDIENAIDYFLYINMIQGIDNWWENPGAMNNCYLTAKKNADGSYSILMTPWDFDKSWSTDIGNYEIIELPYDYNVVTKNCVGYILSELNEDFKVRVKEKYWQLREDKWSYDYMETLIEEYEEDIFESGAFLRDSYRWPDEEYEFSHHSNPENKLYTFRYIVKERLKMMDEWVENF